MKVKIISTLYILGLALIIASLLAIFITSIVLSYQQFGMIVKYIFIPHWSMLIDLGVFLIGIVCLIIGNLLNK